MPSELPKVSVIMNCLNGEQYVRAAIESVYAQTYSNWEIVFLDNASTDATPAIAAAFDGRLRYFRNPAVVPLGQARNQALAQATGEYIAFLDCDDAWLPQKLARQIPLFRDRPTVGLVFSDAELRFQETGTITTYFRSHAYKPPRGQIFASLLRHYAIPMLTAVIRASALKSMDQWFDGDYRVCDDFDFFMRFSYEWECDYVDEALASCLIHGGAATFTMHRYAAPEMARTIEKFRTHYADFDERFGGETRAFLKQVSYKQGKSYWREGRNREARAEFLRHVSSPKFFVSYLAATLPYGFVEKLRQRLGGRG